MKSARNLGHTILSVLSLVLILRSIAFVCWHYTPEAFFDFWFWVSDFHRWVDGQYTIHDLVKAHYGQHRIATTRVLLLLDSILFNMSGLSVVVTNLAVLAGVGLIVWRLARADGVARTGWVLPPLFWIALMVSVGQVENLIFPFQVQFAILCLAACGAAALLTKACGEPGRQGLVRAFCASLCSIVAIFSMASGVLTVPGLLLLLVLRRARPAVWLSYLPGAALGLALFFYHYPPSPRAPLFDASLAVTRVFYIGNFLGSVLTGYPHWAAYAGLCALMLFLVVGWITLRRFIAGFRPIASGDAALLALATAVFLCGPAASLTFRVMMGAEAALVSRYATMSLLFIAALFGLYGRLGAGLAWPRWSRDWAFPSAAGAVLLLVNAPVYDAIAAGWHRVVLSNAQLLRNNVGIEGPAPVIFLGKVDDVRDQVRFLHAQGINMFSRAEGPPAELVEQLRHPPVSAMPPCRGFVDDAFPIDDGAFLLKGWLADPAATHSLPWIAAIDAGGNVLGTSRALDERPDVAAALHFQQPATGFDAGFRLIPPSRFTAAPLQIRIAGLDPGAKQPLCALPQPVTLGPLQITPLESIGNSAARADAPAAAVGFSRLTGGDPPFHGPVWQSRPFSPTDATMRFDLRQPASKDSALIVPYLVPEGAASGRIAFHFTDGTVMATAIRWPWDRPAWRAAVVPQEVVQAHGGVSEVDVTAAAGTVLAAGAPRNAILRPGWSRLF